MLKTKIDLTSAILLVLFVVFGLYMAFNLENTSTTTYGPDFFPKIILIILGIFSIFFLTSTLRKFKLSKFKKEKEKNKNSMSTKTLIKIILFIILLVAYVISFIYLGFLFSTIVFLILAEILFDVKKVYIIILSSFLASIFMYILFIYLFNVPLP